MCSHDGERKQPKLGNMHKYHALFLVTLYLGSTDGSRYTLIEQRRFAVRQSLEIVWSRTDFVIERSGVLL
ncbi:MAG: hypothetical protein NVS4B8_16650 [Herpetosiphon sp.]